MDKDKLNELINNIPVTSENEELLNQIKEDLAKKDYTRSFTKNPDVK